MLQHITHSRITRLVLFLVFILTLQLYSSGSAAWAEERNEDENQVEPVIGKVIPPKPIATPVPPPTPWYKKWWVIALATVAVGGTGVAVAGCGPDDGGGDNPGEDGGTGNYGASW